MNEGGQKVQLQPQLSSGTSRARGAHAGGGSVAKPCPALATPRPVAGQAPLTVGFSRQELWSGLPFPSLLNRASWPQPQRAVKGLRETETPDVLGMGLGTQKLSAQ